MSSKNRTIIPNPNKISEKELEFIKNSNSDITLRTEHPQHLNHQKEKCKGRMISMSDSFWTLLDNYLRQNPTEGSKSGFIVRIVAEYIKNKTSHDDFRH
ncbi:MAG: hypothetical protein KA998_04510 [Rickettsiaceae bacterium]|nr:hypothetical protein [Rickettsiaceae bacterium]